MFIAFNNKSKWLDIFIDNCFLYNYVHVKPSYIFPVTSCKFTVIKMTDGTFVVHGNMSQFIE